MVSVGSRETTTMFDSGVNSSMETAPILRSGVRP